jgi:hypothetical protein
LGCCGFADHDVERHEQVVTLDRSASLADVDRQPVGGAIGDRLDERRSAVRQAETVLS